MQTNYSQITDAAWSQFVAMLPLGVAILAFFVALPVTVRKALLLISCSGKCRTAFEC